MNKKQEQQILDYYSTIDKYIRSKTHSNAHQSVFAKENDKYQWLVLEQKSQCEVEVRQTDSHGIITARDNYELTRNLPKCVGAELTAAVSPEQRERARQMMIANNKAKGD